nr:oligosaccharide flippase family protein [Polymorphobacter sp.]
MVDPVRDNVPAPVSIKRNIAANYVGQGVASLLSLALVPVYIRYLGIEAYSLVGLFAVIQAWMALLDAGMAPTLGREMARFTAGTVTVQAIRDLLRSIETLYLGMAALVALSLTWAADFLARHWLNIDRLPVEVVIGALSMLGVVVALRFCEGIYRSALMGLQQQVWINTMMVIVAVSRSLGALGVLAMVSPTVQAFFAWQGLISVLSLGAMMVRLHRSLPRAPRPARFSLASLATVRRFAGGVFGITILSMMLMQIDKLLLSRLIGLTDFGYYMLAATIAGGLWLVGAPVVLAVAPVLVRLTEAGDETQLSVTYHKASQLVAVLLAPASLIMMVFPFGVLFAWSGDAALAARAAAILAMISAGIFMNGLWQVPMQLQLAAGWTGLTLRIQLVALVVMVVGLFWAVPIWGPIAAAALWTLINSFFLIIGMPLVHRRLLPGALRRWWLRDVLPPLVGAVVAVALAWLVRPAPDAGRWLWLGFIMLTGSVAIAASLAMADTLRGRVLEIAGATTARFRGG